MEDYIMVINKWRNPWVWLVILLVLGAVAPVSQAQESIYHISISDIERAVDKNVLGVPRSVDCTLYWEVYEEKEDTWNPVETSVFDYYRLRYRNNMNAQEELSGELEGNFYTIRDLKVSVQYRFVVEGYRDGDVVAVSDTAYVLTGKDIRATGPGMKIKWHHWIPLNGRIPMVMVGRGYVFDAATKAGKIAFHLIWNFFLIGLVIMLFCFRYLRLAQIFPLEKRIYIGKGFDDVYKQGISDDFKTIIGEWRELVDNANDHIRDELDRGDQSRLEEIEMENVQFWRKKGAETIRGLSARLQKLHRYPTVRIVQAGLENHELGGFRWLEVSKEVDRAIENRASSELEHLRRKSHMDWLWNLGTLAPLVGLFGTATGISFVFASLTMIRTNITQSILVNRLAAGIYEALWTTIEGLFVGIGLMILYYYYQNKLNWIYSKWEEIYVHISEKL